MDKWLEKIFALSLEKLVLIVSILLIILSFDPVHYAMKEWTFNLKTQPNLYLFIPGGLLFILFFLLQKRQRFQKAVIEKVRGGYKLKLDSNHFILLVTGNIEEFTGNEHAAVVLPANTSFDDLCIHDSRSALGSFCLKYFPTGIEQIQKIIREAAIEECKIDQKDFKHAPLGTSVLIKNPLGSAFQIIICAITTVDQERGIQADTLSLISSVKQIFQKASQNRISSLTMPVIGTGHGGIDFKTALSMLLVQCMNSMQHEGAHHVRDVKVVVYDPEGKKKELVENVVQAVGQLTCL